tara:strand:- start:129 stop:860 length:732 start_codon:yes stop_codon:yes gene_type:complete
MDNLKTNFGKRKVSFEEKTSLVQEVFTDVATKYDLMNDYMSFGLHRLWKKEFIEIMNIQKNDKIIDVGSGTGDLINLILKKNILNNIYSVDLNNQMLDLGKKKFRNKKVKFINANAELLPFDDNIFDKYIISFCLRNITNINKAISEANRVLKPGGVFYCLEFNKPESKVINSFYKIYKKNIIPFIGKKIAKNKNAYKYLDESIEEFMSQEDLEATLRNHSFQNTNYINIFNGIVSIHIGYKV